jgi:uncharacterized protein YyaL (SSP411 family)
MASHHTNRLIHESSPYLLQHAHNPVDWYPWGDEAFEKSRNENKPILLSIGYSACHWCHVMERESFENEEIAALMNNLFVNIKVDREERPDLDEIYMNAVQMLTGRGGWPMTMFLTPERKPFYGGTYFPPEDRQGMPGFPKILVGVANAYRDRPQDVEKSVTQILTGLQRMSQSSDSAPSFSPEIIAQSADQIARSYDSDHGGLGQAPKFPHAGVYELFLREYHHSKERRFGDMVTHTLLRMAGGGIYDHLGGGFHRYSVDQKWLVPHFEKMLYDNAQLVGIYAKAHCATGDPSFKQVVEETVDYLLREMLHAEGGFYSTQDADSEGEEGKYFVWTQDEINRILGEETGEIFGRIYDVTDFGNFEGKNILHPVLTVNQAAKLFRKEPNEIAALVRDAKIRLFGEREKRPKPFRDDKILTSWNGLALSGLAEAIKIVPRSDYVDAARQTVAFFYNKMFRGDLLLHTYKNGHAKILGYLDDYALLALGLLDFYEAEFDRSNLERADRLATIMIREFWDDTDGAFFSTGKSHEQLISRAKPVYDSSVPSGNAAATQLLLRLYYFTGSADYLKRAEKALRSYYEGMQNQPFGFAHMLCALDLFLKKPKEIVLVGRRSDHKTVELLQRIQALYLPNKTLQLIGPEEPLERISPLLAGKRQLDDEPTAYVCHNSTCSTPVVDWEELKGLLLNKA